MLTIGNIADIDLGILYGHHPAYFFTLMVGSNAFFHPENLGIELY